MSHAPWPICDCHQGKGRYVQGCFSAWFGCSYSIRICSLKRSRAVRYPIPKERSEISATPIASIIAVSCFLTNSTRFDSIYTSEVISFNFTLCQQPKQQVQPRTCGIQRPNI